MSEDRALKRVYCIRNRVAKTPEEHAACPYCFGKSQELIGGGVRVTFCDFDPDKDDLTFGFPVDSSRNAGC
jgi:hypothetical protein